jgi:lipoprotein-anchoring transpeptidase ErfK/SrfK
MNAPFPRLADAPAALIRPLGAAAAAAVVALTLSSCAQFPMVAEKTAAAPPAPAPETEPEPTPALQAQEEPAPPEVLWEWNGDGRRVSHIWIDVDEQRARFYHGAEQIGWTMIASGLKTHPTPVGKFAVMEKKSDKRSNLYGKIFNAKGRVVNSDAKYGRDPIPPGGRFQGAKMPYFMRLTYDGIGLHAGRIPIPGFPASHGCIRMPGEVAPLLYRHVELGTPVTVTGAGPDYGNYAERQRLERAARIAAEVEAAAAADAVEDAGTTPQPPAPTRRPPVTAQSPDAEATPRSAFPEPEQSLPGSAEDTPPAVRHEPGGTMPAAAETAPMMAQPPEQPAAATPPTSGPAGPGNTDAAGMQGGAVTAEEPSPSPPPEAMPAPTSPSPSVESVPADLPAPAPRAEAADQSRYVRNP